MKINALRSFIEKLTCLGKNPKRESVKLKVRLLLHFLEGNKFLGQTLPEIEVNSLDDLQLVVIETYPGTKYNLYGLPTGSSGTDILLKLPCLKEGYSPDTVVKVMQVFVLPT